MAKSTVARGILLVAGFVSCFASAEDLILSEDTVIDVAEGETRAFGTLGGGAYSLTKTGAGKVVFTDITNSQVRITVAGGTFATTPAALPACAEDAFFHVDGSNTNTMTIVSEGGTNFITRLNDVRPTSSRYAKYNAQGTMGVAAGGDISAMTSHFNTHPPYVGTFRQNARTFVDFGTFATEIDRAGHIAYGWGGLLDWDAACDSIRGVYMVFSDTPDLASFCNTRTRGPFFLSHTNGNIYDFHRGQPSAGPGIPPLFDYNDVTKKVADGTNYLNGVRVNYSAVPAPGFNVLTLSTLANARANSFCHNGNYRYGGQRLAECLIFDRVPTAEEHAALSLYLKTKWMEVPVAALTLAEGAKLDLQGEGLKAGLLDVAGRAELEHGSLHAVALTAASRSVVVKSGEVSLDYGAPSAALPSLESADELTVATEHEARVRTVTGCGTLVKTEAGRLTVNALSGVDSIDVRDGELRVAPAETDIAFFHVDAAATNTMTISAANGTNYVDRWNDSLGNGRCANHDITTSTGIEWNNRQRVVRKPFLDYDDGRPVMNFGSFLSQNANADPSCAGYGAGMVWSARCEQIREVFVFVADTPDTRAQAGVMNGGRGPFLLGDTDKYDFHRAYNSVLLERRGDAEPGYYGRRLADGEIYLDGKSTTYSAALPEGLHLVEFRTQNELPVRAGAFARAQSYRWGGQRLAECLVFTNRIDELHRQRLRAHLLAKWHGSNDVANVFTSVKVAPRSTLVFPYASMTVSSLELGGRLDAERVTVSALAVNSAAEVSGTLALADGATITVLAEGDGVAAVKAGDLAMAGGGTITIDLGRGQAGRTMRVVETESITGDLSGWSASLSGASNRVRLEARADGLYAEIQPKGFLMLLK